PTLNGPGAEAPRTRPTLLPPPLSHQASKSRIPLQPPAPPSGWLSFCAGRDRHSATPYHDGRGCEDTATGPSMSLTAAIRLALAALLVHKGRSALTSLGIIIGIAAVIALVSAGDGAWAKLDERLVSAGKNLIVIRPGARRGDVVADLRPLSSRDA